MPRVLVLLCCLIAIPARAAGDLGAIASRLAALFPGTYSTAAQVEAEIARGVPPHERHDSRYVVYADIAAPQVGTQVLFRQVREGGMDGPIIDRGLAVFAHDPDAGGVRMWLRRLKDAERYDDLHRKPALWPEIAIDPAYGGKCPFHWRFEDGHLTGTLEGGRCKIVSNAGKPMAFEARWLLTADMLSILDNTYDGLGNLMAGRADRVATAYRRLTP